MGENISDNQRLVAVNDSLIRKTQELSKQKDESDQSVVLIQQELQNVLSEFSTLRGIVASKEEKVRTVNVKFAAFETDFNDL